MTGRKRKTIYAGGEGGFSLGEVLVAVTVGSIVLLGLYLLYDVNQVTFIRGEQQTDLQQNARIGMDRIVRELRLAGADPSNLIPVKCPTAILSATPTSVSFIADINSDNTTEKVEYTYDPACSPNCISDPPTVKREQWPSLGGNTCSAWSASGSPQPLAERVSSISFAYYDEGDVCIGGACLATPGPVPGGNLGDIHRISVIVTTQDAQTGRVPNPFTLRAEVHPRNLGLSP